MKIVMKRRKGKYKRPSDHLDYMSFIVFYKDLAGTIP